MWTLTKEFTFEAAHRLPSHAGKCGRIHGHSWRGLVIVRGDKLQKSGSSAGMLVDFSDLKSPVAVLLNDYLDHYHLNETTGLENPTSEELARWIYNKLRPAIPLLVAVKIHETCTSACHYEPGVDYGENSG